MLSLPIIHLIFPYVYLDFIRGLFAHRLVDQLTNSVDELRIILVDKLTNLVDELTNLVNKLTGNNPLLLSLSP